MLTDDQLSSDLSDAFRAATSDLQYAGKVPSPRRTSTVMLPAAAIGVAGIAGAVAFAGGHGATKPVHHPVASRGDTILPETPSTGPTLAPSHGHGKLVTTRVSLAGFTLVYKHPSTSDPLVARVASKIPSDATQVKIAGPSKAYVGKNAAGVETAYVKNRTGLILSIGGPGATRHELVAMLQSATPRSVPLVGPTTGMPNS